ncbi:MAG: hypothetical protein IH959_05505 [Chloroflexi bacterium]|nr:hypothetical protein [Chloroflexota bacterium]
MATGFNWDALSAIATLAGSVAIGVGVVVGLIEFGFAARAQRDQAKAAESQHLMGVLSKWEDRPLEEARRMLRRYGDGHELKNALEKLEEAASDDYFTLGRVPDFFEDLGVLVFDLKVVKAKSVRNSLGSSIRHYWRYFEPYVETARVGQKQSTMYEWFEKLSNEMA